MEMQARIRHGAETMQDAMRDMGRWEQQMKNKDISLRQQGLQSKNIKTNPVIKQSNAKVNNSSTNSSPPVRSGARLSVVHSKPTLLNKSRNEAENSIPGEREEIDVAEIQKSSNIQKSFEDSKPRTKATADSHTYDKGYKKWESFDVDSALKEVDEEKYNNKYSHENGASKPEDSDNSNSNNNNTNNNNNDSQITPNPSPASIITPSSLPAQPPVRSVRTAPLKRAEVQPRDVVEKERGNEYYKAGNWSQAVKCYSRAIAFNNTNHILYSNRAMALLKLKEFRGAEDDCSKALDIVPAHVKSLTRRGTARTRLGRHKLATVDFARALEIQPGNKGARAELRKNRESVKANARRVPRARVEIKVVPISNNDVQPVTNSNGVDSVSASFDVVGVGMNSDATAAVASDDAVDAQSVENFEIDSVGLDSSDIGSAPRTVVEPFVNAVETVDSVTDSVVDSAQAVVNSQVDDAIDTDVNDGVSVVESNMDSDLKDDKCARWHASLLDKNKCAPHTSGTDLASSSTNVDIVVADSTSGDTDVNGTANEVGATDAPTIDVTGVASVSANADASSTASRGDVDITPSTVADSRDTVLKRVVAKSRSSVSINMSPKSGYEFVRSWRSLRGNETARLDILLKNVGQLTKLLMPVLDPELLSEVIITCTTKPSGDTTSESPDARAKVLHALTKTRSFSTVAMFLDKSDSKKVKELLQECSGDTSHTALKLAFKC